MGWVGGWGEDGGVKRCGWGVARGNGNCSPFWLEEQAGRGGFAAESSRAGSMVVRITPSDRASHPLRLLAAGARERSLRRRVRAQLCKTREQSGPSGRCSMCFRCGARRDNCRIRGCIPYVHKLGMQKVKSVGQVLKNLGTQKPPRRYATDCEDVSVVVRWAKCTRRKVVWDLRVAERNTYLPWRADNCDAMFRICLFADNVGSITVEFKYIK